MNVAVHGNPAGIRHGGGAAYVFAIGCSLASFHRVDLFLPFEPDVAAARMFLPDYGFSSPKLRREFTAPNVRVVGELWKGVRDLRYDLVIVQSTVVPRASLSRNCFVVCEFPFQKELSLADRVRLRTFKGVLANSHFTAGWIAARWARSADVLHPPVVPIPCLEKRPYVLSVGRFVSGARSKRQLEMVGMFEDLLASGVDGWELHLAGFVQDPGYAREVSERAAHLPVHCHFDVDRATLEELYGVSSIFWHAVGLGVDPELRPEALEHFGIVTVEAMSAGCVPVVLGRGGQPEVVGDGVAGAMWETMDECIEATASLINDSSRLHHMASEAAQRSKMFGPDRFAARLHEIVGSG